MTQTDSPSGAREVDTLIHPEWLLPMVPERRVLERHSVAVEGQRIVAVLPRAEAAGRFRARREFSLDGHALLPGLINAHGHAPMTLLRGYADDMPLMPWLHERIWPAEAKWVSEDFVYDGACLAIAEMLLAGITTFSDMYFFPEQVGRAAQESRMRVQLASPVLDFPTVWARDADEYIHKVTQLKDDFRKSDYVRVAFGPHAAYTVSEAPLRKISMLADELDIPIHIHLHENDHEVEEAMQRYGLRHVQRLEGLGLLSPRLQAVHLTQLNAREIELLAENGVHAVHCPASNLKLASGTCPVAELLDQGVNLCLGTDGAASNNDLDIFQEMRLAALVGKGAAADAAAVDAWTVLRMATLNGARALGLEEQLGSVEPGKYADLVAVDLDRLNSRPVYDPASSLVYSASAGQVSHVWVGGQLNVEDRKLRTLDAAYLMDRAQEWADRITAD